jgi:endonuclease-8
MRVHNQTPIGEAVMNQTVVCGIGNVYKSEMLFLARVSPFVTVGQLSDECLQQLVQTARRLMKKNLEGYPRRTRIGRDGNRVWVYRRSGQPCFVCGTRIKSTRQGDLGRSTFWCSGCQPM